MKKVKIILVMVLLSAIAIAQSEQRIPLIGEKAPSFKSESTNGIINFPEDFGNNWKLIFSHPMDFTPVCTSELLELASMQNEFKELDVDIIVVSTDTLYKHHMWLEAMEEIKFKNREYVKINFPLVDDNNRSIAKKYGMLHDPPNLTRAVRGVYIVDSENTIRFLQFYPTEVGRNIPEIKRAIIALQTSKRNDVYIPANWEPGDDVLLYHHNKEVLDNPDVYQLAWFLTYKKQ